MTRPRFVYYPQPFDVTAYGAKPDDSSFDDTAAIQATLNDAGAHGGVVLFPPGRYRVTDNLWIFGHVSIVGEGNPTVVLEADPTNVRYWINCGGDRYGSDGIMWRGSIRGMRFELGSGVTTNVTMLNVHLTDDAVIEGNTFDLTAVAFQNGGIRCYNDAGFVKSPARTNLRVLRNRLFADQGQIGSEAIGVGTGSNIQVVGNIVEGFGDDVIALHACSDFVITGNSCKSYDGRILVSHGQRGIVSGNTNERVGPISGGGLLYVFMEKAYTGEPAPQDIVVSDNVLLHSPELTQTTYGIRVLGGQRVSVHGNMIIDDSGWGRGVEVAPFEMPEWDDPDGQEEDGWSRPRSVMISGNLMAGMGGSTNYGGLFETNQGGFDTTPEDALPGPIVWEGNQIRRFRPGPNDLVGQNWILGA